MRPTRWTIAAAVLGTVGVAYRLEDFGRHAFWTDEAWVALSTRTTDLAQWWLSLSVTPIAWAACLRALAFVPGPPEVVLRLLPLATSLACLVLAYRLGARLAGHPAGGLAALAIVATDPLAVEYAKILKQYGTEAALALATAELALAVCTGVLAPRVLAAVLVGGSLVANAELFMAAPALALVVWAAWRDGARARLAGALRAAAATAVGLAVVAACFVAPRRTPGLAAYYATAFVPTGSVGEAAWSAGYWTWTFVVLALGRVAGPLAAVALVALARRRREAGLGAALVALLVIELVVLSALRLVPVTEKRVLLFALTLAQAVGAAGLAGAVVAARGAWRGVAVAALVVAACDVGLRRDFVGMGGATHVEDLGPLVRLMETRRAPADRVLVYRPSGYVVAYYLDAPPRLDPLPATTVGWVVRLPAPFEAVSATEMPERLRAFLATGARVWFVGSRIQSDDADPMVDALARATVLVHESRDNAELVLVAPPR